MPQAGRRGSATEDREGIQGQSFASTAKVSLAVPMGRNCRCTGACGLELTATTSGSYSPSAADSAAWPGRRQMLAGVGSPQGAPTPFPQRPRGQSPCGDLTPAPGLQ